MFIAIILGTMDFGGGYPYNFFLPTSVVWTMICKITVCALMKLGWLPVWSLVQILLGNVTL